MSQDLKNLQIVLMCAQKERKKFVEIGKERGVKRENLVPGRRKGKKDLIGAMIFTGSLNAEGFEGWLSI